MLAQKIKETNPNVIFLNTFEDIKVEIERSASDEDVILVMGAGDITEVGNMLVK
jgi:UDP-N-acetylmuramate-alanine ligase